MAMIRPETEMKDSGVQWIGDIPSDWNIKPLYACLDEINQKNNPVVTTNILSLTNTDGVIPYSERGNQGNKSKENFEEYKVVYPNTIVANSMNILIGSVGLSKYEGCVSPVYYVYMAKPQVDIRYMNYLFQMEPFQKRLRQFANGILEIRLRVSSHDILHQKVAVPDYDEQQVIADYLDETCSQIDEIIAEAKASIDEYKELKQSVIFEAVTKGLDKNVEMKDSCVEWIGEIPSSWQLRKLKTFTVMISKGTTPKDMSNVKTTLYCVRYLKSENIKNNHLDIVPKFYITEETHNELSRSKLNGNDVLFVIAGASIGKVAIMDENLLPANTNQANAFIRIKDEFMDSIEYLWMLLQSVIVKEVINRYSVQSAQPNISMENLGNIKLPYPLLKRERDNIMNYLREKVDAIDSLISEKESLINDLEAYKKSLIYEVVTGKRRVV